MSRGQMLPDVLRALGRVDEPIGVRELARLSGWPAPSIGSCMCDYVRSGRVVRVGERKPYLYRLPTVAERDAKAQQRPASMPGGRLVVSAEAAQAAPVSVPTGPARGARVVWPEGVRVTRAPDLVDRRYEAAPGHIGAFMAEWHRVRGRRKGAV